ncbi:Transcriptional regulator, LysR family [hydrothermal vent metagenome]|uniref:Transcriptional regulator, LysR family n=1 Tax=hydrothermal vent metagenome TaxID=652676 RepID=A0A3B0YZ00_9ZZZZ
MHTLDWDDIRHFLEVVRCGSAIQAAIRLGINHTTVYRRISALEDRLGKNLFERAKNGWVITPVGERIVAFAESMAEDANNIERQILADSHELRGLLRVTAADHCVDRLVMPAIRKFIQRYPEVDLEMVATADELDLAAREADVALRGTDQPPPNLVGKRIARIGFAVYGTQALMEQATVDPDAEDLPCITWVGDGHTRPPWIEKSFPNARRIYRTTSIPVMLAMAREGIGVARLACVLGDTDRKLHRVQARYVEPGPALWILSHVDLRTTARVRIFRDFLVEALEKQKDLIEGKLH